MDGWWTRIGKVQGCLRSGVAIELEHRFNQLVSNDFSALSGYLWLVWE